MIIPNAHGHRGHKGHGPAAGQQPDAAPAPGPAPGTGPAAGAEPRTGAAPRPPGDVATPGTGAAAAPGPPAGTGARYLAGALALIVAFMAAEVTIGLLAHSLALVSDAAHMLTDAAGIALALTAMRLSARPPAGGYTYGLRRTEILSAQANGITLLLLSAWLTYEAVGRLISPPAVAGGAVLATALVGLAVNACAAALAARADRRSLNVEGAFRHILTDAYAFAATAIAGLIVIITGFDRIDAIASLVVVALMAKAGIGLLRVSGRIFLEAAPHELSPDAIGRAMAAREGVVEVHDLHIWQITSGMPAASAHVLVGAGLDCHAVRMDLERLLADTYRIRHTTLQVDHAPDQLLTIRPGTPAPPGGGHCPQAHGPAHHHRDGRG
jgi:cobalt-zinc-cadmium efflux system protein